VLDHRVGEPHPAVADHAGPLRQRGPRLLGPASGGDVLDDELPAPVGLENGQVREDHPPLRELVQRRPARPALEHSRIPVVERDGPIADGRPAHGRRARARLQVVAEAELVLEVVHDREVAAGGLRLTGRELTLRGRAATVACQVSDLGPDSSTISARLPHDLGDERLLELIHEGRSSREPARRDRAAAAMKLLAAREHPRVLGLVASFRFPGQANVRVHENDHDDAATEAYLRLVAMLRHFRSASVGQFRAAVRTCVHNTCMDWCRAELTRAKRLAGSLDEPLPGSSEDDDAGRYDAETGRWSARRYEDEQAARAELAELGWALGQLDNERQREVLRLTMEGHSSQEIGARIGASVANVDQLRSRGTRELRRITHHGP
jgi:RNA polymerase sigma factor (sigma-70 family)